MLFGIDLQKLFTGALIAGGGAAAEQVVGILLQVDFGPMSPYVAAGLAVVINGVRLWVRENLGGK